jgi:hypothetical protein
VRSRHIAALFTVVLNLQVANVEIGSQPGMTLPDQIHGVTLPEATVDHLVPIHNDCETITCYR